jgi:hypothetical protein
MCNSHSLFQKSRTAFDKTKTVCHTDRRSGKGRLTATDLLLFLPAIAMQIGVATAGSYVASTITFSNQMPTGVLIYKCQSPDCTKQKQLGNSGYITPVPTQYTTSSNTQNTLDPAPQAFIYEMGTYVNGGEKMCQMAAQKCTGQVSRKGPQGPFGCVVSRVRAR